MLVLDHLVILTRDLERAERDYETLGFTVTSGGEHADGLTRNALIAFSDGTYLELVSFTDPDDSRDNVWGWRRFLSSGGGLIDHCVSSGDLTGDVQRLRKAGLTVDGPEEGGRRRPDGENLRWLSANIQHRSRALPFLISDLTLREKRVPTREATLHPNGARGVSRLEILAAPEDTSVYAMLASASPGVSSLQLGRCVVEISPATEGKIPGPASIVLETAREEGELDRMLTHGATMRLESG